MCAPNAMNIIIRYIENKNNFKEMKFILFDCFCTCMRLDNEYAIIYLN